MNDVASDLFPLLSCDIPGTVVRGVYWQEKDYQPATFYFLSLELKRRWELRLPETLVVLRYFF